MKTKNTKRENCITELPASYRVRVFYTTEGVQKCYSKTFKYSHYASKEAALVAAIEDRDRVHASLNSATGKVWSVDEIYEQSKKYMLISAKTVERHQHFYGYAIGDKYGARDIHTITSADIQESLNVLQEDKSDDYIKRVLSVWKRIYKTCAILELPIQDKTLAVVAPKSKKIPPKKREPLTPESFAKVIAVLQPDPLRHDDRYQYERGRIVSLVWLLYLTGMRPAEALALTTDDWDKERRELQVFKSVGSTKNDTKIIVPAKTPASVRTIYLNDETEEILEALDETKRCGYLFARYDGQVWDIDDLTDLIYQLTKKAGIKFKLYDLRHDFATRMLKKHDPATVRDLMGHTNFNMSIQYARTSADDLREAMQEDDTIELSKIMK